MTTTVAVPMSPVGKFRTFAADIKISHTLFALPWALLAMFLAAGGMPRPIIILLILGCMVSRREHLPWPRIAFSMRDSTRSNPPTAQARRYTRGETFTPILQRNCRLRLPHFLVCARRDSGFSRANFWAHSLGDTSSHLFGSISISQTLHAPSVIITSAVH